MTEQSGQHSEEEARKYAQLVANAWLDAEFNRRLRDNPAEVLREAGIEVPEGVEVKVVDPDQEVRRLRLPARPTFNFTLPPKPASLEEGLSDEQLRQAQVGILSGRLPIASGCSTCIDLCEPACDCDACCSARCCSSR
jgi:hypothetical protein